MKKHLLLTSIILLVTVVSQAQWQPDVRLTNDPAASYTSYNNAWCIAANGDSVHVVWFDNRDGNDEIYYKRSTDGGISWGADVRLTNDPAQSEIPSVAVSGSVVHVVWIDERDGYYQIYYKRSTDGGISWGADVRLTNSTPWSVFPSVAVSGSVVHVVWEDTRDGNREIYYKRSTDGGISWGADTRLTNSSAWSDFPSVAVSGSVVHVVWQDDRDGNFEIYYKRSTDGGSSWSADTRLTNNSAGSFELSVAVSGSVVHVVWDDDRDGNWEIYYKRSTDGGTSWGADVRLTNNSANSWYPSVAVSGSVVHVVWQDDRDGNWEIYYKLSTDGGISWGADVRLTNAPANSEYSFVSVSGSVVHVVWQDTRDGNDEIYYKRDPIGNPVGIDESFLNKNELKFSPNPFSGSTVISLSLTQSQKVSLNIFDVNGRLVTTLADASFEEGDHEITWNAAEVNAGVYFLQFQSAENLKTEKLILTK
ncbi:MAG TPA: exo-alpha-sialidase [Bacteroidia bacterium]|nr:exo-alpha-sialidase [Bacteroidia bacterium]